MSILRKNLFEKTVFHVAEIVKLGKEKLEDIAILTDKNRDGETLQALLKEQGIPSLIFSSTPLLETEEVTIFLDFFNFIEKPWNLGNLRPLLLSPLFGATLSEIEVWEKDGFTEYISEKLLKVEENLPSFFIIISDLRREGANFLFERKKITEERFSSMGEPFSVFLIKQPQGELSLARFTQILDTLQQERQTKLYPFKQLKKVLLEGNYSFSPEHEGEAIRLIEKKGAVQILTIHGSKGLEFKTVFFCGAIGKFPPTVKGVYQFLSLSGRIAYDYTQRVENKEAHMNREWEERKRLFYVAFTRAVKKLFIPSLPSKTKSKIALEKLFTDESGKSGKELIDDFCDERNDIFSYIPFEDSFKTAYFDKDIEQSVILKAPLPLTENPPFKERRLEIKSYSSLLREKHTLKENHIYLDEMKIDKDQDISYEKESEKSEQRLILPAGADFGNLVHKLFEIIDFTTPLKEQRSEILPHLKSFSFNEKRKLGLSEADFEKNMFSLLEETLKTELRPINHPPFSLNEIPLSKQIREGNFLSSYIPEEVKKEFYLKEENLLTGDIDLLFEHEGKLFLLDWKSNRLNNYDPKNGVREAMNSHNYHLQRKLYQESLKKYLSVVEPDTPFEQRYGGVFYLFVRGLNSASPEKQEGVFYSLN